MVADKEAQHGLGNDAQGGLMVAPKAEEKEKKKEREGQLEMFHAPVERRVVRRPWADRSDESDVSLRCVGVPVMSLGWDQTWTCERLRGLRALPARGRRTLKARRRRRKGRRRREAGFLMGNYCNWM